MTCWYCGKEIQGRYVVDVITSRTHDGPLHFHLECKRSFEEHRAQRPESFWDYCVLRSYEGEIAEG